MAISQDVTTTTISAAEMLYRAEIALHDARHTGVDEWIAAASRRLHDAVLRYEAATAFAVAA